MAPMSQNWLPFQACTIMRALLGVCMNCGTSPFYPRHDHPIPDLTTMTMVSPFCVETADFAQFHHSALRIIMLPVALPLCPRDHYPTRSLTTLAGISPSFCGLHTCT